MIRLFLLALLSPVLLLSCSVSVPPTPSTLKIGMGAEPDVLNPILASDAYGNWVLGLVNDSLIERDKDTLEYIPKLAKSWKISPDHLEYTFYLRDDVKWQDGAPFTADDVIYSLQRVKDPTVEAPFQRVYYADVDHAEKIDDYTVKFVTTRPYFMALGICGTISIVPKHIFDDGNDFNNHPANRAPIGTGPYKFVEWVTNKKIVLERNENYWGPKPAIKRVEFLIITDSSIMLQMMKKGDLDQNGLRPIQWVRQTDSPKFNREFAKYQYLSPGFRYIGWNNKSPFFSDKKVRLAMTSIVDRDKLLEKIDYGLGKPVESPFFLESPAYNKNLLPHAYDPNKARALLAEAGWKDTDGDGWLDKEGKKFEFTFLYPASSKFSERLAPILKEDLKNVGIVMNIERMEWAAFLGRIEKRDFDATCLAWSSGFEDDPYQIWHSSQAHVDRGSNFVSFENKEADTLIEQARTEFDETKRDAMYKRFQEILYDEQPYTFMWNGYALVALSKKIGNVKVHKTGLDMLEWTME